MDDMEITEDDEWYLDKMPYAWNGVYNYSQLLADSARPCREWWKETSWYKCQACNQDVGDMKTEKHNAEYRSMRHLCDKSRSEYLCMKETDPNFVHMGPEFWTQLMATYKRQELRKQQKEGKALERYNDSESPRQDRRRDRSRSGRSRRWWTREVKKMKRRGLQE